MLAGVLLENVFKGQSAVRGPEEVRGMFVPGPRALLVIVFCLDL